MIDNRAKFLEKNRPIIQVFIQEIPFHTELREQFIEHVGTKVMARFVQIIEYYQSKDQICAMPTNSVIRLVGSTIIGYFVTKNILAAKMEWDDEAEVNRMVRFLMKGLV